VTTPTGAPASDLAPAGELVAVALSIVVASETRKAVRRHTAPNHEKSR
jgi:hypothetical protein